MRNVIAMNMGGGTGCDDPSCPQHGASGRAFRLDIVVEEIHAPKDVRQAYLFTPIIEVDSGIAAVYQDGYSIDVQPRMEQYGAITVPGTTDRLFIRRDDHGLLTDLEGFIKKHHDEVEKKERDALVSKARQEEREKALEQIKEAREEGRQEGVTEERRRIRRLSATDRLLKNF